MTATESYYQKRIEILELENDSLRTRRDLFEEELNRWKINASDIGWKGESPSTWMRNMARSLSDIPFYQETIKGLTDTVARLTDAKEQARPTRAEIETAQALAQRTPKFT